MDLIRAFEHFEDHLAPRLDTYEQTVYLYILRHSRLVGLDEVTIGFKSARRKMAFGIGEAGKPMSEGTCYEKLRSLEKKGCVEILSTDRAGTRMRLRLPNEIPGVVPQDETPTPQDPETFDFFSTTQNRVLLLEREAHRCFYCLCRLDGQNHVVEHVRSRPHGNNSYRNVVAACILSHHEAGRLSRGQPNTRCRQRDVGPVGKPYDSNQEGTCETSSPLSSSERDAGTSRTVLRFLVPMVKDGRRRRR